MTAAIQTIRGLVDEIRALGANVDMEAPASEAELRAAEEALGFPLPEEYRVFVTEVGGIQVELVRTWFFYGLAGAKERFEQYDQEFADGRDEEGEGEEDGPYFPRRFLVLVDEGDYSNAAEGYVYDADQDKVRFTAGLDYMEADEYEESGILEVITRELEAVRDRIADPSDPLVGGCKDEVDARRKLPS